MHASVAVWDGDRVTMYETSQGVVNHRVVMAQTLGIPVENVRVVTRFLGSGFGGKLFPWPHCAMTAVAARKLGRPVKLSLTRRMMFSSVGYRPRTEQRIRLGASNDGKLLALQPGLSEHHVDARRLRRRLRRGDSLSLQCRESRGDQRASCDATWAHRCTCAARAPFRGCTRLNPRMNELADELKIDPLKLRILNDAEKDEGQEHALLVAPLSRVPRSRREEVRLGKTHGRHRLDAARWQGSGLGTCRS